MADGAAPNRHLYLPLGPADQQMFPGEADLPPAPRPMRDPGAGRVEEAARPPAPASGLDALARPARKSLPASQEASSAPTRDTILMRQGPDQPKDGDSSEDVVQFASNIFFCMEEEECATCDVMRIGGGHTLSRCAYHTRDVSAKAGDKYIAQSGFVEFQPGEVLQQIRIPIVNDNFWDSTLEFQILLHAPQGCLLGPELFHSRVLILDDDIFPSNKFKKEVMQASEEQLASISVRLLLAFIRFVFLRVPTIWWKSTITALLDQLWNVYFIWTILLRMYLVDTVMNIRDESTEDRLWIEGNRYMTAMMVAIAWVAPNLLLLFVGRLKVGPLDMCKAIRQHFQVNLFRRYLNYTEDSKRKVPVQDLTIAMDADIPMLVDDGYMGVFDLLRGFGKIVIVAGFMIHQDMRCIIPLFLFPVIMLGFLRSRQEEDVRLESKLIQAEAGATGILVNAFEGFRLIRDYGQRHAMAERYSGSLEKAKGANDNMICFKFWNGQLVPWLTLILVGLYIAIGSQAVLLQEMTVGQFLALVQIYQELGDRFQGIYNNLEASMQAGSPLCELTRMLNLPTDMHARRDKIKLRREFMIEKVNSLKDTMSATESQELKESLFDKIPIIVSNLHIPYVRALSNVEAEAESGSLVFITGPHGSGKATLVRLIAGIFVPERGSALYSSHSRCLHVSERPEVMPYLSLYQNLTFGAQEDNPALVQAVIARLGLEHAPSGIGPHWIMELLNKQILENDPGFNNERLRTGQNVTWNAELDAANEDDADEGWSGRLSHTERKYVNLARALLYNPEVLVLQKPLDDCDSEDLPNILSVLREYVDFRGCHHLVAPVGPGSARGGMARGGLGGRRPRTVFFSGGQFSHSRLPFDYADVIWHLDHERGVVITPGGGGNGIAALSGRGEPASASARSAMPPNAQGASDNELLKRAASANSRWGLSEETRNTGWHVSSTYSDTPMLTEEEVANGVSPRLDADPRLDPDGSDARVMKMKPRSSFYPSKRVGEGTWCSRSCG